MDKTLRSILWILVALVVLSSFSTGWFFVAKERLYNNYIDLENLFKTSMERLDREIASSKEENEELESKLAATEKELNRLESRSTDIKAKYEALLIEKGDLDKELARVKKGKFFLEKKLKDTESDMFVAGLLRKNVSMEVELKRLKGSLTPKDLEIEKLKKENMNLTINLSEFRKERDFLEQKAKDAEVVSEILSRDLLTEKDNNQKNKQEFENAKVENRLLKTRLSEMQEITDKFDRLLAEKEGIEIKVANLEKDLAHKENQLDKIRTAFDEKRSARREVRAEAYHTPEEVELPPIVLEREKYEPHKTETNRLDWIGKELDLKGRIVTVNREHNFVVVDLGKQHGINMGTAFNVYRDRLFIGTLEVIQCRERIAACDIKYVKEGFYVEIDDAVAKR